MLGFIINFKFIQYLRYYLVIYLYVSHLENGKIIKMNFIKLLTSIGFNCLNPKITSKFIYIDAIKFL